MLDTAGPDPARAVHVVRALRQLLSWPSLDETDLANVTAVLNVNLAGMPADRARRDRADSGPVRQPPRRPRRRSRRSATRRDEAPPGRPESSLEFTYHQHLSEAMTDSIEGYGAHAGAYDRMLIARLASYLDPVDVGVVCSWIDRAVAAVRRPWAPEGGRDDA